MPQRAGDVGAQRPGDALAGRRERPTPDLSVGVAQHGQQPVAVVQEEEPGGPRPARPAEGVADHRRGRGHGAPASAGRSPRQVAVLVVGEEPRIEQPHLPQHLGPQQHAATAEPRHRRRRPRQLGELRRVVGLAEVAVVALGHLVAIGAQAVEQLHALVVLSDLPLDHARARDGRGPAARRSPTAGHGDRRPTPDGQRDLVPALPDGHQQLGITVEVVHQLHGPVGATLAARCAREPGAGGGVHPVHTDRVHLHGATPDLHADPDEPGLEHQSGGGGTGVGMAVECLQHRREPTGVDHGVVVHQRHHVGAVQVAHRPVAALREAQVRLVAHHRDLGELVAQAFQRAVDRCVVDQHDLEAVLRVLGQGQRPQATAGEPPRVPVQDHHADAGRGPLGCVGHTADTSQRVVAT